MIRKRGHANGAAYFLLFRDSPMFAGIIPTDFRNLCEGPQRPGISENTVKNMGQFISAIMMVLLIATSMPAQANTRASDPQITQLLLDKSDRKLYLLSGKRAIRSYSVDLGANPTGHKRFQGDGRTPEGLYHITHRNPNSNFFLSLGISYPNDRDRAHARQLGRHPGGDIFIHGQGARAQNPPKDWTRGCAAVSDREMAEIFQLVQPGTPIFIKP